MRCIECGGDADTGHTPDCPRQLHQRRSFLPEKVFVDPIRPRDVLAFDRVGVVVDMVGPHDLGPSLRQHPLQTGVLLRERNSGRVYRLEVELDSPLFLSCGEVSITLTEVGRRD